MAHPFSSRSILGTLALSAGFLGMVTLSCDDTPETPPQFEVRALDGTGNNIAHPDWGTTGSALMRRVSTAYEDGVSMLPSTGRPGPRQVSNAVVDQGGASILNSMPASDFVWAWGQFIDHDITLTVVREPLEPMPIPVPTGDPMFDPMSTGTATIGFSRSDMMPGTGVTTPREQVTDVTAFIDASTVYGSSETRLAALRANDGTGRLATSTGNLLPFNTAGLPNEPPTGGATMFLAGDIRANENIALLSLHTLWVREHNRLADEFADAFPSATGDEIFELARRRVIQQIQLITVEEWLPMLLGPNPLGDYQGYDADVQPKIRNIFAAASFRLGHTLISPTLQRVDENLQPTPGPVSLMDAFFRPDRLVNEGGIAPILRGLSIQRTQQPDTMIVDDLRNFLMGAPGSGGMDLASINIQRGRDHGLPDYATARADLGLAANPTFADVTADTATQARLASVYSSPDDMDLWVAGLAEDPVGNSVFGELITNVITEQFQALRDGDRLWYENTMSASQLAGLRATTTLAAVIRRNTTIDAEISNTVFTTP